MKKIILSLACLFFAAGSFATGYPVKVKVLKNGLKVIVCEMPSNGFVQTEVWYRTGSKDEKDGTRGIAHMFEHAMFLGTKKYPGSLIKRMEQWGLTNFNASTDYDRTIYYEYTPVAFLDTVFDFEADRMANLVITQDAINTEREVIAEEYSNGINNWLRKMDFARHSTLYPDGHPYKVDVIGYLEDIENFTAEECKEFYNNYYSPDNAFLVVAGDVKSDSVFAKAEKYFGAITKQLNLKKRTDIPDIVSNKIKITEMGIDYPFHIYSFVFPRPETGSKDARALDMLISLLFTDPNSILNERIINREKLAFGLNTMSNGNMIYSSYGLIDFFMQPGIRNAKVKTEVREEINKVIEAGISQEKINKYLRAYEASYLLEEYEPASIANRLGEAEFFFNDPFKAANEIDEYKKITSADLKAVAAKYLSEDVMQIINIKPSF